MTNRVLVLTLEPYKFSTRAGKAARAYASSSTVDFLTLSKAGRTKRWDEPGRSVVDRIRVNQLNMVAPALDPSRRNQVRNLLVSYLPALLRMFVVALRTRADVVHVTGAHLGPVGLAHSLLWRSRIVLDVTERPGMVSARGSVTSIVSRFEFVLLRMLAARATVTSVATDDDAPVLRDLGFDNVVVLRNAPQRSWRAEYQEPRPTTPGRLETVVVGSIFEGRGYEMLVRAVALCKKAGHEVRVGIAGPARESYLAELQHLTEELDVSDRIDWLGRVDSGRVSQTYLGAQVGLVLYESDDAGNDGLSNKLMECVSTGRPVIAGDLPQNRRFVETNGVGWLAPMSAEGLADVLGTVAASGDPAALAAHCRSLGDDWLNWEAEFSKVTAALD